MKISRFYPIATLPLMLFNVTAHAESFEAVGTVEDVRLDKNLIVVNETIYSLPNKTALNTTPVILQLRAGHLIGFSGSEASPYSIIESVYVYPYPAYHVEQEKQP